jgi:hypothetical protein
MRAARRLAAVGLCADGRAGTFLIGPYCVATTRILAASASALRLRETVRTDSQDVCADSGVVTLTPVAGGRLRFRWVDDAHADNVATGTFTRTG